MITSPSYLSSLRRHRCKRSKLSNASQGCHHCGSVYLAAVVIVSFEARALASTDSVFGIHFNVRPGRQERLLGLGCVDESDYLNEMRGQLDNVGWPRWNV